MTHAHAAYYATAPLKMKLGINQNIMIDSIDELIALKRNKIRTETSIKNNEIEE